MREFRARLVNLKAGSIFENGTIVTANFGAGSIATCSFGKVSLRQPVSRKRWAAYLRAGWRPVPHTVDFEGSLIIGDLERWRP